MKRILTYLDIFRCTSPLPLIFTKVAVTINTPTYNSEYAVDNVNLSSGSLEFNTDEVKRFVIEFMPDSNDVNNEIQVSENCNLKSVLVYTFSRLVQLL